MTPRFKSSEMWKVYSEHGAFRDSLRHVDLELRARRWVQKHQRTLSPCQVYWESGVWLMPLVRATGLEVATSSLNPTARRASLLRAAKSAEGERAKGADDRFSKQVETSAATKRGIGA